MLEQWIKENANMKDRGSVAVINDDVWILPPRCFSQRTGCSYTKKICRA